MTQNKNILQGYKESFLGIIPKEWEVKRIKDYGKVLTGSTPPTSEQDNYGSDFLFVSPADLLDKKYITTTEKKLSDKGFSVSRVMPKGTVLFTCIGSTIGKSGIASTNLTSNQQINAVICNKHNYNEFLYYELCYKSNRIKLFAGKQAVPIINKTDFENISIVCPSLQEQQKIAEILSIWDVAIEKQTQLITQLETRKHGLMQQLLTGKKRVKGFEEKWKKYHLGNLGDTYSGLTGKNKDDFGEGKPYIPYLNIFNNPKIDKTYFEFVKVGTSENQNKTQYGDIFFTVSSETPNDVGMASVLLENIEVYLNSFCFGFRLHDFNTLLPEFGCYYLRSEDFRSKIYKLSQGATRFNLSKNSLMKLYVVLPTLEEQNAIADILSTADTGIVLAKKKLASLKEQKKGLMQVLLTGKKRVKYIQ